MTNFHHPTYFFYSHKCYGNYVEAGTNWPKCPKLSSRAKMGTLEKIIFSTVTGLLTLIFGWQMSKGVISTHVKGFNCKFFDQVINC